MSGLPNTILGVRDAVRADRSPCYGHERTATPSFGATAVEAVLRGEPIAPVGWALPDRASLFTGLFPSEHSGHSAARPSPQIREWGQGLCVRQRGAEGESDTREVSNRLRELGYL